MTRETFDLLVRDVEKRFSERPGALRRRLVLLALTGYLGLCAWLGIFILLAAILSVPALVTGEGGAWALAALGWLVLLIMSAGLLKVLWVRVPPPEGRVVLKKEAPALHAMLEELRASLQAASFYRVVINPDCNAGVSEIPRLGLFGWPRHYLTLGLPLLDVLCLEELRAVLAHEFAHLSRRHGRISAWVYRLRRSWEQLFARFQRPQAGGMLRSLVNKFIEWFWPRFNAHAFVLSRAHEFEADAAAAAVVSPAYLSSALLRINLASRLLEDKFWPGLWRLANEHAAPPPAIFDLIKETLLAGLPDAEGQKWINEGFDFVSSNADTHPCMTARWEALGVRRNQVSVWPLAAQPSAAEVLLGPALPAIRRDIDHNWRTACEKGWKETHGKAASLHARLQSIDAAVANPGADAESLWDKICVVLNLQGQDEAEPLLRQMLVLRPNFAPAHLCLGRHLLASDPAAAELHLERAMAVDEELVPAACGALLNHFRRVGSAQRIRQIEARLDQHEAALKASQAERFGVSAADTLLPHGLGEALLAPLRALLEADSEVIQASLAQKQLKHFPNQKFFVLCVKVRRPWHGMADRSREHAVASRFMLKARLPGRLLIFPPIGSFLPIARKIAAIEHSTIFERSR